MAVTPPSRTCKPRPRSTRRDDRPDAGYKLRRETSKEELESNDTIQLKHEWDYLGPVSPTPHAQCYCSGVYNQYRRWPRVPMS